MNRYIYYACFLLAIMFTGCELDRLPNDAVVDENFWRTEQDFQLACNALYPDLPSYTSRDSYSDICFSGSPNEYSSGSYLPSNDFGPWKKDYNIIATTNKIIKNAQANPNKLEDKIVKRYEGEARFFRAWQYYDLLRSYGGVPIVDKLLDQNSEKLYAPRNSRIEVVTFILQDLDFAISVLPWPSEVKNTEYGRFTKSAAYTLKSRVALYEGTRQKYVEGGDYSSYLQAAKEAADAVIQSGEHKLFNDPSNDPVLNFQHCFTYEGEGSAEIILAHRYQSPWQKHNISASILRSSSNCPTRAIVDAFLCEDGLPIEVSDLFEGYDTPTSEFQKRDPRMVASLLVPTVDIEWNKSSFTPTWGQNTTMTGYTWKKMGVTADAEALEGDNDIPIMRYAEILLNYAEATFELTSTISDEDLNKSINVLRKRVNMPYMSNAFINAHNLSMSDEIRRERLVELAMEGFRYDDLLRWGTAPQVLTKPLLGIPDLREFYPIITDKIWSKLNSDGFVELQPASERVFEKKHYLWPIPLVQIALNENLKQNPGWE